MLRLMTIKNIALIEQISLEFGKGLHILSGETGAGKSIVVDAVNLLLGTRADRDLIRSGEEKAFVEAFFDVQDIPQAQAFLAQQEIETDHGEIVVSREISQAGKNICRIGGVAMSLTLFKAFTSLVMNIHGQHEHQFLLDEKRQLAFLDEFGGKNHRLLLEEVKKVYARWHAGNKRWKEMKRSSREKEQRIDTLRFQLEELTGAKLIPGEEEALKQEQEAFRNNQKIQERYEDIYTSFFGKHEKSGALQLLEQALEAFEGLKAVMPEQDGRVKAFQSLLFDLQEQAQEVKDEYNQLNFDPQRLEEIEVRLDTLKRLERKYGSTVEEMIAYFTSISKEYEELVHLEENLEHEKEIQIALVKNYRKAAKTLTEARKALALHLEKAMEEQLKDLGMEKTKFAIAFAEKPTDKPVLPQEEGNDEIAFLIAPNPGEPLQPLAKIASGGELSRLMLAIKSITAQSGFTGTMVFDEIDTGIGGSIAWVVGEKMAKIAKHQQVICVTHLGQIAAMADRMYLVKKDVVNDRTKTTVTLLGKEEKVEEIARIIGGTGEKTGDTGLKYALSMLEAAEKAKEEAT